MGAWGTGVFSDDTAEDVRTEYRQLLEDQIPDQEAAHRIVAGSDHLDADERHILWLALAAAQFQVGRLDEEVKSRALDIIDTEHDLDRWQEAGAKEMAKRKAALAKLRENLTGPQPPRKVLRRPWRHETDLRPGDVLSFTATNGRIALLRVSRIDDHRLGAAPVVEWLDWAGTSVPNAQQLEKLRARPGNSPALGGPRRPATYQVARQRLKDPDWRDVGMSLVAHLQPRPGDATAAAWSIVQWGRLSTELERDLTS